MKWFYSEKKIGVIAETQPEGYQYNFRGENLSSPIINQTEAELIDAIEFEELKNKYMKKFGKKPNGRSKADTLRKALGDDS